MRGLTSHWRRWEGDSVPLPVAQSRPSLLPYASDRSRLPPPSHRCTPVSRRRLALAVAVIVAIAGCRAPLADTYQSPDAVAAAVLDALVRHDRAALERLALSEQEFRNHVWRSLPAARPERNLPVDYVWGDLHQKSQAALEQVIATHGGRRYELVSVAFDDVTDYGGYRVHRQTALHVRDASGAAMVIRVCGSMIEQDGGWKVFSYVVDD